MKLFIACLLITFVYYYSRNFSMDPLSAKPQIKRAGSNLAVPGTFPVHLLIIGALPLEQPEVKRFAQEHTCRI